MRKKEKKDAALEGEREKTSKAIRRAPNLPAAVASLPPQSQVGKISIRVNEVGLQTKNAKKSEIKHKLERAATRERGEKKEEKEIAMHTRLPTLVYGHAALFPRRSWPRAPSLACTIRLRRELCGEEKRCGVGGGKRKNEQGNKARSKPACHGRIVAATISGWSALQ